MRTRPSQAHRRPRSAPSPSRRGRTHACHPAKNAEPSRTLPTRSPAHPSRGARLSSAVSRSMSPAIDRPEPRRSFLFGRAERDLLRCAIGNRCRQMCEAPSTVRRSTSTFRPATRRAVHDPRGPTTGPAASSKWHQSARLMERVGRVHLDDKYRLTVRRRVREMDHPVLLGGK